MMRILMVSDVYFPRINGVSTSMETFRSALRLQGVDVRLVVPRYGDEAEQEGVVRVAGRPIPGDREDRLMHWRDLNRVLQNEAPRCDLIHIQTPFLAHYAGLRNARTLGKPVLATYHTLFEEYLYHYAPFLPKGTLRGLARRFSRVQCNALDGVIVPSTAMRERLIEYGVTTPMPVLPTGIPLQRFQSGDRGRFRTRLGIEHDRPVALYVGRVAHEKNIDFLLDVVARAKLQRPDLLLLITGEGPARDALQARTTRLGLDQSVRFLGYLDRHRELPDAYAAADVFVFASCTETQGLVLLEAMAMGLPVVALAKMGTRDILDPGQGCIAPDAANEPFAQALIDLINAPERRQALSIAARAFAHAWGDDQQAAKLAALYRMQLGSAASTAA